jgi:hypothetical protein
MVARGEASEASATPGNVAKQHEAPEGRQMTKDEYFAALREWYFCGFPVDDDLPHEWIAEAWELPEVQDWIAGDGFVRNVSKTGSLCYGRDYLANLSACLSDDQVRKLYLTIREVCSTREAEFRPEFLSGFAEHAHAIPPALTDGELAATMCLTIEEMKAYDEMLRTERVPPPPGDMDDIPF